MRLWADAYDAAGALIGTAPITNIISASVTKALDGAGKIALEFPATDERALSWLTVERRIRLYWEWNGTKQEVGRGTLDNVRISDSSGGAKASADGKDSLDELTRKSVLLGNVYENQMMQAIATDLIANAPGWSAVVTGDRLQSARFDGSHVLKSLTRLAQEAGYHLRAADAERTVDIGVFGDIATVNGQPVRAIQAPSTVSGLMDQDHILLIRDIEVKTTSRDLINSIVLLGAGEGAAALTGKQAYDDGYINVGGATLVATAYKGQTIYMLKDNASIAQYGEIQRVVTFKEIAPISNSTLGKLLSSKALVDAGAAYLARYSQPLSTYRISVLKNQAQLKPGQKINIRYKGTARRSNGEITYIDVDDTFWVLRVTTQYSSGGASTDLEIASVDRYEMDTARIVVDVLDKLMAKNVSIQTFPAWIINSSREYVQASIAEGSDPNFKKATFKFKVDDYVTDVVAVRIQFISENLFTTGVPTTSATWTPDFSAIVVKSTNYPSGITLFINGVDCTTEFGGPWGSISAAVDEEIDITQKILNASGGIYQDHLIEFKCTAATGNINYTGYNSASSGTFASNGVIFCEIRALVVTRAILPE